MPAWLVVLIGMGLVIGAYLVWGGLMQFFNASGNITAPITAQAAKAASQTQDQAVILATPIPIPTATPVRPCLDFRVNVVKAVARDCAKLTCATLEVLYPQGALICVYGVDPTATDWYIVNLRPTSSFPDIAYMNSNVLYAVNPTPYPTRTFTALPTITPTSPPRFTPTPTAGSPGPSATHNANANHIPNS
ncbi:MAG: hypothetical protein ACYDBJ_20390 [Aggregatilineales bacterium]